MATKKRLDVIATVGEYEKDGKTMKRYAKCGSAFVDDKGDISIKLDTIPAAEWNGWLSLKEPFNEDRPARQQSESPRASRRGASEDFGNDAIPF